MTPAEKQRWREKHEAELEARRLAKASERSQRQAIHLARANEPRYNAHDVAMAATYRNADGTIGVPVAEYVELMEERRKHMRLLPPLDEQLATAPVVNPVTRP